MNGREIIEESVLYVKDRGGWSGIESLRNGAASFSQRTVSMSQPCLKKIEDN